MTKSTMIIDSARLACDDDLMTNHDASPAHDLISLADRASLDSLAPAANDAIAALADILINDDDLDLIDAYRLTLINLAASLEICPIHTCDANICNDDNDLTCAELRN